MLQHSLINNILEAEFICEQLLDRSIVLREPEGHNM